MKRAPSLRSRSRPAGRPRTPPLLASVLLLALVASCAGAGGSAEEPSPPALERRSTGELLAGALSAADSSDHATAALLLEAVRDRCGTSPAGGRATLLLAAIHLDPRHADGEPQAAADMAAGYLSSGVGPAWSGPLARTLYLEALEKGARPPDPAGLGTDPAPRGAAGRPAPPGCRDPDVPTALASSRVLPELPGTPMAERLEALRARVAELEKELERIREILDEP